MQLKKFISATSFRTSASIATTILISIGTTALISGLTIGGKALFKRVAIEDSTKVVYRVARIMNALHLFR